MSHPDVTVVAGRHEPPVVEGVEGEVHDGGAVDEDGGDAVGDAAGLAGLEYGQFAAGALQREDNASGIG